jgi:hypothetical protein
MKIASCVDNKTFVSLDRLYFVSTSPALTSRPLQTKLRVNFRLLSVKSKKIEGSFHERFLGVVSPTNAGEELAGEE